MKYRLPLAHKYKELHESGRDDLIPFEAMELTTVVAEAIRMCELENGPDHFDLELTGLCIGNIAFVGIPGEPFTEIGVQIWKNAGWDMILPCCLTNGTQGYSPTNDVFEEGGYEARSSQYVSGIAEGIIDGASKLLNTLQKQTTLLHCKGAIPMNTFTECVTVFPCCYRYSLLIVPGMRAIYRVIF